MTAFSIETLCQNFATEFQDWLNLPDRNCANETLQKVTRIILHRVASRLNLAPRLTDAELEAKMHAVVVNKRENESWGNAIRREFNVVACGDGVDWKAKHASLWKCIEPLVTDQAITVIGSMHNAPSNCDQAADAAVSNMFRERDEWKAKYQSAKEELEESEHARHLQIEELASVHSEIEAAERERDALAARVRELEDELKTFVMVRADRIEKEKMRDMHRRMLSETVAAFTEAIDSLHRFYGKQLTELENPKS